MDLDGATRRRTLFPCCPVGALDLLVENTGLFSPAVIKAAWVQTLALIPSGCETWDKFLNFPRPQFLHLEDGMRPHRLPSGVGMPSDNALARDPLDGTYS